MERDDESERFEPFDETLGFAFRVAALVVVAAEVSVELAGEDNMCQQAQMIECLIAPGAFLWPRRGFSRVYWAAR
ncbi:MAG: hypothetical protein WBP81_24375 [Solirubrobacteraceae bacterium]